jgi:hypothetical protein
MSIGAKLLGPPSETDGTPHDRIYLYVISTQALLLTNCRLVLPRLNSQLSDINLLEKLKVMIVQRFLVRFNKEENGGKLFGMD